MALRRLRSDYERIRGTILCVAPLTIPDNLNRSAASGEDRLRWLEALPAAVEELTDRWSLTVGEPYSPGGTCAWVAPVRNRTGDGLVLKLAWVHEESAHEADGLRLWNGDGAVRLYESHQLGDTVALLLERCVPGHQLAVVVPEPEQDPIVTGLLARLWVEPALPHPFRSLELMCEQWATSFELAYARLAGSEWSGRARGPNAVDPGLAAAGIELLRTLPHTAPQRVLLCTDLHGQNILAAEREPWLVIDPKPYIGDPAYDLVQHMLNCERLRREPRGLAQRLAGLAGLDPGRVKAWLLARCVQESIERRPELASVAAVLARETSL